MAVIFLPKIINKFTPKVIYKEIPIWRIKTVEVVKEVPVEKIIEKEVIKEVPVYKGEKIVEKEKIVYQSTNNNIFQISKLSEEEYVLVISNPDWDKDVGLIIKDDGIHFKGKRKIIKTIEQYPACVSMSTVGWN